MRHRIYVSCRVLIHHAFLPPNQDQSRATGLFSAVPYWVPSSSIFATTKFHYIIIMGARRFVDLLLFTKRSRETKKGLRAFSSLCPAHPPYSTLRLFSAHYYIDDLYFRLSTCCCATQTNTGIQDFPLLTPLRRGMRCPH